MKNVSVEGIIDERAPIISQGMTKSESTNLLAGDARREFHEVMDQDVKKINAFYKQKLSEFQAQLHSISNDELVQEYR